MSVLLDTYHLIIEWFMQDSLDWMILQLDYDVNVWFDIRADNPSISVLYNYPLSSCINYLQRNNSGSIPKISTCFIVAQPL